MLPPKLSSVQIIIASAGSHPQGSGSHPQGPGSHHQNRGSHPRGPGSHPRSPSGFRPPGPRNTDLKSTTATKVTTAPRATATSTWRSTILTQVRNLTSKNCQNKHVTLQDTAVLAGRDDNIHVSSLGMIMGDDCTPGQGIRDMMRPEANKPEAVDRRSRPRS